MTTRALLTAEDAKRLTQAANDACCMIEVKRGDTVITIIPDGYKSRVDREEKAKTSNLLKWEKRVNESKYAGSS